MARGLEQKSRKLLAFDLKQEKLKEHYPKPYPSLGKILNPQYHNKAYRDIEQFFKEENWEHKQGSGYISSAELTTYDVMNMLYKMVNQMPWLSECINKCDIGNISDLHDLRDTIQEISKQAKTEMVDIAPSKNKN